MEDVIFQLKKWANKIPNEIAIKENNRSITYKKLYELIMYVEKNCKKSFDSNDLVMLNLSDDLYYPVLLIALTDMQIPFVSIDADQPKKELIK